MPVEQAGTLSLVYKTVCGLPIKLDVYHPSNPEKVNIYKGVHLVGALVYFHGGGLTSGNRGSWFPSWLQERINAAGHAFISPDYRLIPSGLINGHDILDDIRDVFKFITSSEFEVSSKRSSLPALRVDPNRIAVAGTSSGGTCAYLAASRWKFFG
ncbi:hypothetical protein VKT23_012892 [Stygiomarasmius scandens]|uniref:Alpha/beta hydrolase fold-3 domain-containing protein n=1 Tax=Marasmiellus scandens TaxID=2682957 RepID=A0ABR1J7A4_9AGAR